MRVLAIWVVLVGCDEIWDLERVPDHGLSRDLVAYFPMDELEGGNRLVDRLGGSSGACLPGQCPTQVPGIRDGALLFDGANQMITAPTSDLVDTPSSFTAAAWFRIDGLPADGIACPVSKLLGAETSNTWQFCAYGGTWFAYVFSFSAGETITGPNTDIGRWHHFAVTWNTASLQARMYVDGVVVGMPVVLAIGFDDGPIFLGADLDYGAPLGRFPGAIDDVRVYSRDLTDVELFNLVHER